MHVALAWLAPWSAAPVQRCTVHKHRDRCAYAPERPHDEITVEYTLTIDGDKLKGKGAAEFGGQKQEFDITGKREKKGE